MYSGLPSYITKHLKSYSPPSSSQSKKQTTYAPGGYTKKTKSVTALDARSRIAADKKKSQAIIKKKTKPTTTALDARSRIAADKKKSQQTVSQKISEMSKNIPTPDFSRGSYSTVPISTPAPPPPPSSSPSNRSSNSQQSPTPEPEPAPEPEPDPQPAVEPEPEPTFVSPTPAFAPPPPPPPPPPPVKTADPDIVQFNEDSVSERIIADLLFENIGGQELLTISREDTVNGQEVVYQPISNLGLIQQEYNPNNIVRLTKTARDIFANFSINLDDKIPNVGNGTDGQNVYADNISGDILVEFVNIEEDEDVDIQVLSSGTIYRAGIE